MYIEVNYIKEKVFGLLKKNPKFSHRLTVLIC